MSKLRELQQYGIENEHSGHFENIAFKVWNSDKDIIMEC